MTQSNASIGLSPCSIIALTSSTASTAAKTLARTGTFSATIFSRPTLTPPPLTLISHLSNTSMPAFASASVIFMIGDTNTSVGLG
ncbi:hypothetical protein [Burkholderia ubonensis]|uniref:hypothetical protein n=1 Tax=Burkholderia ubonensis TaxID=101571 RepID=UPI001E6384B7|nr:hypothetical protein [Burkholderia ubonensis]